MHAPGDQSQVTLCPGRLLANESNPLAQLSKQVFKVVARPNTHCSGPDPEICDFRRKVIVRVRDIFK